MPGLFVMRRVVTKKSATAKTQMNIGGCTGEKRGPSIDLFSQMILALIDDSCAILRLDVKKRKLPVDLVKFGGNCHFTIFRAATIRVRCPSRC